MGPSVACPSRPCTVHAAFPVAHLSWDCRHLWHLSRPQPASRLYIPCPSRAVEVTTCSDFVRQSPTRLVPKPLLESDPETKIQIKCLI